jgi:hypothetical protein
MTKPQLATGPQKWVVLGPTGLFRNDLSAVAMAESSPSRKLKSPAHATGTESPDRIQEQRGIVGGDPDTTEDPIVGFRESIHQIREGRKGYLEQLSSAAAEGRVDDRGRGVL